VYDETRAVHALHTEKLEQLDELIEELNGAQLVIFYWYEFEYQMLLAHFGGRIGFINSQTPEKSEQAAIKAWNKGELELLAIQPASGGHGLNLQGSNARYVVWYSLTNDYDLYDQGNRRVYRSGNQADKVVVFRLIATGTVDEALVKMMARKSFKQAELVSDLSLLSA
jgi:SNF2 family DNA or RNA helicase